MPNRTPRRTDTDEFPPPPSITLTPMILLSVSSSRLIGPGGAIIAGDVLIDDTIVSTDRFTVLPSRY